LSPTYAKLPTECSLGYFLGILTTRYSKAVGPILPLNTSKDVVTRKMCLSNQSINQSFICPKQHKKQVQCTIQCRTGYKGMIHLQVPETKPNNKNTKIT